MNKLKFLLVSLFALLGVKSYAQQEPDLEHYMVNPGLYNPAYVGTHAYYTASSLSRRQWVGIKGAPFTSYLSIEGPVPVKPMGIGGFVMYDEDAGTQRFQVSGQYSY